MKDLSPIEHKDQRILLTGQVAEMYGTTDRRISENYSRNVDRYRPGRDFYLLEGEALKAFKREYANCGIAENINKLYLWTEHGALLHAKSLGTDKAWEAYGHLVDTYFRARQQPRLPSNYLEALKALVSSEESKLALQTQNLVLEQKVCEYEPKVQYVDKILSSPGTLTIKQIAQDYGLTAQELNEILHEAHIQYKVNDQWILYREHLGLGYTKSDPIPITRSDGRSDYKLHTKWTQKGRYMIHQLLEERGIKANMDKEENQTKLGGVAI